MPHDDACNHRRVIICAVEVTSLVRAALFSGGVDNRMTCCSLSEEISSMRQIDVGDAADMLRRGWQKLSLSVAERIEQARTGQRELKANGLAE